MVKMVPTWLQGYIEIGHAYFKMNQQKSNEAAIKSYMKAIRIANLTQQEITDQLVFQRAGDLYIKEGKWEDARVMFLMCAEDYKTSFSHFNLGVAAYNLGEYEEAERVLSLTNYMDPTHAPTWAYLCLTLLKKPDPPLFAAYQSMNESIKLGLSDSGVLHEIALRWVELSSFRAAREAFEQTITIMGTQKMPGPKTLKRINDYFAACQELLTTCTENVDELREKLRE